jgi:hypothetical protein
LTPNDRHYLLCYSRAGRTKNEGRRTPLYGTDKRDGTLNNHHEQNITGNTLTHCVYGLYPCLPEAPPVDHPQGRRRV